MDYHTDYGHPMETKPNKTKCLGQNQLQSRFAERNGKKKYQPRTGLGNRGHLILKVLNDIKLVLNEHE